MNPTDVLAIVWTAVLLGADVMLWMSGAAPTFSVRARYWSAFHSLAWRLGYLSAGAVLYWHLWG